jgi:hypothetical protein
MGSNFTNKPRRWRAAGPILIATIALAACGGDDDDAAEASLADAAATGAPAAGDAAIATEQTSEETDRSAAVPGDGRTAQIDFGAVGRDVIVEMHVLMSSDDIARSVASITASAASLGGGIASSDVNYGTDQPDAASSGGHAVLVVKVPPEAVDRLLEGLDTTGRVQSINQSAQDVTEQLVDLEVRIANARTSVANVRQFMDSTTNLTELVALEAELTRRQTELEQLEAQQRNLDERVAMSTVTIEVVPTAAIPVVETDEGILDALASGWEAFVAVLFGIVFVLAVLAPFLVVGLLIAAAVLFATRRRDDERRPAITEPFSDEQVSDDRENATPVG